MKRAFILFWHGLTALLVGIANWFTVILGMRDDSKYGKILRRTVGSCFAFLMLLLAIAAGWDFCRTACYRLEVNKHFDGSYYDTQYISRNVTYYTYYDEDGFLKTADGKKTITGIRWIAKPLGMDSLICYSDGKKRGYFNMFTGKPVIEPKYSHAWIFSDGLASVDDGGWIKFIDASGKVVIDPQIPYIPGADVPEFNYLSPTRRETAAVHNIGGDNLPVVIAARLDGDMDFNPQFVPDYIYTGRSIPKQLPEGMQCIIDADVWMEHSNGGTEPDLSLIHI